MPMKIIPSASKAFPQIYKRRTNKFPGEIPVIFSKPGTPDRRIKLGFFACMRRITSHPGWFWILPLFAKI
jgi:hypothetical protein